MNTGRAFNWCAAALQHGYWKWALIKSQAYSFLTAGFTPDKPRSLIVHLLTHSDCAWQAGAARRNIAGLADPYADLSAFIHANDRDKFIRRAIAQRRLSTL
ncbi:hypothetical protein [Burkholderia sp. SRS-W-2-2016]|uniref:hypothetical protein n=1 Tax=Burkholderia sp. SRS-W-2-2016 TaxID=1926878 RepID=UPI00117F7D62|nr:hypothetical protein [Burkholderia sp. SRS-W-2-2016]